VDHWTELRPHGPVGQHRIPRLIAFIHAALGVVSHFDHRRPTGLQPSKDFEWIQVPYVRYFLGVDVLSSCWFFCPRC